MPWLFSIHTFYHLPFADSSFVSYNFSSISDVFHNEGRDSEFERIDLVTLAVNGFCVAHLNCCS